MLGHVKSGPYQGRTFDHNDINLYFTRLGQVGPIHFFLLPPLANWDDVTSGSVDKEGPFEGQHLIYWMERHPDRIEFHFDETGEAWRSAQELAKTYVPPPMPELKGSDYECAPAAQVPNELGWAEIVDEKDRRWRYREHPKDQKDWFGAGFPAGVTKALSLYAENLADLRCRLSDVLD